MRADYDERPLAAISSIRAFAVQGLVPPSNGKAAHCERRALETGRSAY
jgi:hypothetical protein